jgi:hypothetical protein
MEERERCYSFILSRTPHETSYTMRIKVSRIEFLVTYLSNAYNKSLTNAHLGLNNRECCNNIYYSFKSSLNIILSVFLVIWRIFIKCCQSSNKKNISKGGMLTNDLCVVRITKGRRIFSSLYKRPFYDLIHCLI